MREGRYTFMKHRMSRLQRAKQFMPFAALKGFETLLAAVARPKEGLFYILLILIIFLDI